MVAPTPAALARLAKAELHCHLDGLLDLTMLRHLHEEHHLTALAETTLAAALPIASKEDWIERYVPVVDPHLTAETLQWCLEAYVGRAREQGLTYLEIMLSGMLNIGDPDHGPTVDRVRLYAEQAALCAGPGLQVAFLVAIGRTRREKMTRQVERILALRREGLICGFALAGEEEAMPCSAIADLLERIRDTGMGIEIHAGEWGGPEIVRDAIEHGRPDRIGHGLAAFDDPRLPDLIGERGIHLEFCPTSNVKVGKLSRIEDHPIGRARDLGLSFSINTDDPGPFECSMTGEYERVARTFGFGEADFEKVYENSLAAGFAGR